jgi:FAD/FMN-containing dehydrogenase
MKDRVFAVSGNSLAYSSAEDTAESGKTHQDGSSMFYPKSTEEIARILKDAAEALPNDPDDDDDDDGIPLPRRPAIAVVCGGCEASNAPFLQVMAGADDENEISMDAKIIMDLKNMKGVSVNADEMLVTVSAGVTIEEVVKDLKTANLALPLGTGQPVGIMGFLVNGGMSGYFSRRLGLLSQRVLSLTVVDCKGNVSKLTSNDENTDRFVAMLGAGSALGIVTEATFRAAKASILHKAHQYVFVPQAPGASSVMSVENEDAEDNSLVVRRFSRKAIEFMREKVMPDESVSMEVVTTATNAAVVTVVFYDTFNDVNGCCTDKFCDLLLVNAKQMGLVVAKQESWDTYYEVATALWPVIAGMEGHPLAMIQHCCGTRGSPSDDVLDFIEDVWIGEAPFQEATMSIVEARTLGGAIRKGTKVPSGNMYNDFFVDLIVIYDAGSKTIDERKLIAEKTSRVVANARQQESCLVVDFSGTHSQLDDNDHPVKAVEIFGGESQAKMVKAMKDELDPHNRFRFHPFARILK